MSPSEVPDWSCGRGIPFPVIRFREVDYVVVDDYSTPASVTYWALVRKEAMTAYLASIRKGEVAFGFSITWVEVRGAELHPVGPEAMKALDREVLRRGIKALDRATQQSQE